MSKSKYNTVTLPATKSMESLTFLKSENPQRFKLLSRLSKIMERRLKDLPEGEEDKQAIIKAERAALEKLESLNQQAERLQDKTMLSLTKLYLAEFSMSLRAAITPRYQPERSLLLRQAADYAESAVDGLRDIPQAAQCTGQYALLLAINAKEGVGRVEEVFLPIVNGAILLDQRVAEGDINYELRFLHSKALSLSASDRKDDVATKKRIEAWEEAKIFVDEFDRLPHGRFTSKELARYSHRYAEATLNLLDCDKEKAKERELSYEEVNRYANQAKAMDNNPEYIATKAKAQQQMAKGSGGTRNHRAATIGFANVAEGANQGPVSSGDVRVVSDALVALGDLERRKDSSCRVTRDSSVNGVNIGGGFHLNRRSRQRAASDGYYNRAMAVDPLLRQRVEHKQIKRDAVDGSGVSRSAEVRIGGNEVVEKMVRHTRSLTKNKENLEVAGRAFREVYLAADKTLKPLLAAYAMHTDNSPRVKIIIVDGEGAKYTDYNPSAKPGLTGGYNLKSTISVVNDLADETKRRAFRGTVTHEIMHMMMKTIYENKQCNPYLDGDDEGKQAFEEAGMQALVNIRNHLVKVEGLPEGAVPREPEAGEKVGIYARRILDAIGEHHIDLEENTGDKARDDARYMIRDIVLSMFKGQYTEAEHHAELVVRAPQAIGAGLHPDAVGLLAPLVRDFEQRISPALRGFAGERLLDSQGIGL